MNTPEMKRLPRSQLAFSQGREWVKTASSKMVLGMLDIHVGKSRLDPPYTAYRNQLRRDTVPTLKNENYKILEEKARKIFMILDLTMAP